MDKILKKEIENSLCNYFIKEKVIYNLNKKINFLQEQIKVIENEINDDEKTLENYNFNIKHPYIKNHTKESIISIIEKKQLEISNIAAQINNTKEKIRNIEIDSEKIKVNIEELKEINKDYMELLRLKYGLCKYSEKQIAFKLHSSQPTINRMKEIALSNIAKWNQLM
ncbi:hypothetical protein [Clostridium sp. YIM B02506]|uniref:hypothetical protein n=1 Tax=Clostridium sp. YIM B02506 TaxID=2910680 RepID=UPI001EEDBFC1|nr:hypothetical protein [Clostridium sp. YIM B02506]